MPKTIRADKAKQGRRGFPVLVVLVCALLLAIAVWWGVDIYGESLDDQQAIETQKSTDAPETPTGPVRSHTLPDDQETPPAE